MDNQHKYIAWKEGEYWRGQELVSLPKSRALLAALHWKREVFATIQTYDEFGNILWCPLYFDFDGEPNQVHADVKMFVQACEFTISCTPRIYFSGNKGFHVIIDYPIHHPLCHFLVRDFALEMCQRPTLDLKVYRSQAMLRIPGSPASKPGFFKIQLTRNELFKLSFDEIKQLAKTQRFIEDEHDPTSVDTAVMEAWLPTAIARLPKYDKIQDLIEYATSVDMEITPCIKALLTEEPYPGDRHETVFLLARFLKNCGLDHDSAVRILKSNPGWADYAKESRDIEKTFRSVFFSQKPMLVGCKSRVSTASAIMRSRCDSTCHFSPDFPKLRVFDAKGKEFYV